MAFSDFVLVYFCVSYRKTPYENKSALVWNELSLPLISVPQTSNRGFEDKKNVVETI